MVYFHLNEDIRFYLNLRDLFHLLRSPLAVLAAWLVLGEEAWVELGELPALGEEEPLRPLLQRAAALEAERHQRGLESVQAEGGELLSSDTVISEDKWSLSSTVT